MPVNTVVFDLDKAPRNTGGKVEFSADMVILKPVDLAKGSSTLFFEVNNRGRKMTLERGDLLGAFTFLAHTFNWSRRTVKTWVDRLIEDNMLKRKAIGMVASTLASSGDVFTRDDDLELVGSAIPFGLKLYESLLDSAPTNKDLLVATCSNFTQYGVAFLETEAAVLGETNHHEEVAHLNARALKLYLRAKGYCLRAMEVRLQDTSDPCEIYFSDYRPVNGKLLPHRFQVYHADVHFATMTVTGYTMGAAK